MQAEPYAATLGSRERWATLGAIVLAVGGLTVLGVVFTARTGEPLWLFLSLPFALVLFVVARFAPTGYRLTADGVVIDRRVGSRLIPYRAIRAVDRTARPVTGFSVGASKGVFGRFGCFWNHRLGFYRLYLSNTDHLVWLDTSEGWVGLSPDRPDQFVARLGGRLAR